MKQLAHKPGAHGQPARPDNIEVRTVPADAPEGLRLIDFLAEAFAPVKRTTVKAWLKYGQVRAAGNITSQFDTVLHPGNLVEVNTSRPWQTLSHPRLRLVYEDDDIIVVSKGYGLLSVGTDTRRGTGGESSRDVTAYSILRDYLKRVNPANKLFIVHRLDQHTSGLMMFAKSIEAKEAMQHNWNNMVIDRRYAAIVEGYPEPAEGTVDTMLAENSRHVVYVPSDNPDECPGRPEDMKRAVTRYTTVKKRGGYALLDVSLDTGRKNQIRVHMQHLGHPIAGDRKYGAKTSPIHRLCLHARTLRFAHPITRRDMNFEIPLPSSFSKLV